jgi:Ni/Fe-hydrogenase subunit HybB-like protein
VTAAVADRHDELMHDLRPPVHRGWLIAFAIAGALTVLLFALVTYTFATGIGVFGTTIPAAWAFPIVNFVFWIGIGHAGTLISAVLYLCEQRWRTAISRIAETMTLFAVIQAALFPVLHLGRPWFAYWLLPYPDLMGVWPQVKSALPWDAAAISTYFLVSLLFWYIGLVPDLAIRRDHAATRARRIAYGLFALGWRGSATEWRHWRAAYLVLAGIATPLVVSVHSIVSSDFAIALVPGWHSTVFPPFFVAGAIFSGFAMVLTLVIPIRAAFRLHHVITPGHLDRCAKLIVATGMVVAYGYLMETFIAWYSGDPADLHLMFAARPATVIFWVMLACNVVVPQIFWSRWARHSVPVLFGASLLINVGMWSERFVIVVRGLERDQLPASWGDYTPSWVDVGILAGTFGFFALLFLIFLRTLPLVPVAEMKEEAAEGAGEEAAA